MSLTKCQSIAIRMPQSQADELLSRIDDLVADGMNQERAQAMAANDMLRSAEAERVAILEAIAEQYPDSAAEPETPKQEVEAAPVAGAAEPIQPEQEPVASADVAESASVAPEQLAELERILDEGDRAAAAELLDESGWNATTAKKFLSQYVEWLQEGTKDFGERLSALFRKVLAQARNGLLSIAVAVNFSVAPMAPPVPMKVTERNIVRVIEKPAADFKGVAASADARYVADHLTRNSDGKPFIIADKNAGLMYAFTPDGNLIAKTPALYGKAKGDTLTAKQQTMAVSSMKDSDKITPAGIFKSKLNPDANYGKTLDIAQYDGGTVSIHRVYLGNKAEQRDARLATDSPDDNRVSYGCINALPEFMEQVIEPHFADGGTVAVLPETTDAKSAFGLPEEAFEVEVTTAPSEETQQVAWGSDKYADRKRMAKKARGMRRRDDVGRAWREMTGRNKFSDWDFAPEFETTANELSGHAMKLVPVEFTLHKTMSGGEWVALAVKETEVNGAPAFTTSLETGSKEFPSGTGIATRMYLAALYVAQQRGIGWISEGVRSANALAIYDRLKSAGVPFVERGRASYIDSETLKEIDLQKVADSIQSSFGNRGAPKTDQTDTPAFRKWFKDSKVVDAEGNPLVVYHGTQQDIKKFSLKNSAEGVIFFSADPAHASMFAQGYGMEPEMGNVIPAYISMQNPLVVDGKSIPEFHELEDMERLVTRARAGKHDGVIIRNFRDTPGHTADTFMVFHPEQIKSAIGNDGTFDADDPSIVSEPKRGYVAKTIKSEQDAVDEVPNTPRANQPPAAQSEQLDLFAAAPVPGVPGGEDVFGVVVEPAKRGTLRIGFDTLDDPDKAAHAFAALRKSPREAFQLIVLDKDMKPIASWDLFKGTLTQTSVYPREVISAAYSTPGAAYVWYAHNHPSGVASPSAADERLTRAINSTGFSGTGVEFLGHIIIGTDEYAVFDGKGGVNRPKKLTPASRKFAIPILERVVKRQKRILPNTASSPSAARDAVEKVSKGRTGIMMLDAQHGIIGWASMSVSEMAKLKTEDANTGGGKLFRMISRANPAAVIVVEGADSAPGFKAASRNVAGALIDMDVSVLDSFFLEGNGRLKSSAELGESLALGSGGLWNSIEGVRAVADRLTLQRIRRDHADGNIRRIHIEKELRRLTYDAYREALSPEEFRIAVDRLADHIEAIKHERSMRYAGSERARGADIVREKLLAARRRGELEHDTVELALWLLDKNPDIADDLGISVREGQGRAAGNYNPLARIMTLIKGGGNPETAAHELLHHAERMMPTEVRDGITTAWARGFAKAFERATPAQKETLLILAELAAGVPGAVQKFQKLVDDGKFDYDLYQFTNPSEFWAVNGARILRSRAMAEDAGWIAMARQWLREFIEKIKDIFKLASDAAVIRGLAEILETDGAQIQPDMIGKNMNSLNDIPDNRPPTVADFAKNRTIRQWVEDHVGGAQSEIGVVGRKIGSMYGIGKKLAAKGYPEFLRVFWKGQDYLSDQAGMIKSAQQLAPDVLPGMDSINPKKLIGQIKKSASRADMRAVGKALNAGTLYGGGSPLQGRKWSREELLSGRAIDGGVSMDAFPALTERQADYYQQVMRAMADMLTTFGHAMIVKQAQVAKVNYDPNLPFRALANQVREAIRDRKAMLEESMMGEDLPLNIPPTDLLGRNIKGGARPDDSTAPPDKPGDLDIALKNITSIVNKINGLIGRGYFPLMRFGKYFITVRDRRTAKMKYNPETGRNEVDEETGTVKFFGRFDSFPARNAAMRQIREEFPDDIIKTGEMPKTIIFEGLNLDMLELFAEKAGMADSEAYQQYLKMATFDHSAMRRFIHRQGTPGFDEDPSRVLASFLVSTSRNASGLLHLGEMLKLIGDIPKSQGVVTDRANNLYKYLTETGGKEELAGVRSFIAHDMLLGTLAGGMVNMTQIPMATFPELAQHIGSKRAASEITQAVRLAAKDPSKIEGRLGEALRIAEKNGWTEPQEVYLIVAMAADRLFAKTPAVNYALKAWGFTWSVAEIVNRRTTFIAAYQSSTKYMGMSHGEAIEFAKEMIVSTQGAYNKGNRPEAFRGAGTVIFQFQMFKVIMLELLKRLPWPSRWMLLGMLWMASGVRGLPFYKDIDDIMATFWQWFFDGAGSPDKGIEDLARAAGTWAVGKEAGNKATGILMNGASEVMPFDIAARLGLGDIIPATGFLRKDNPNSLKDASELLGVAASRIADTIEAIGLLGEGKSKEALLKASPRGVASYAKSVDMAITGKAKDSRGGQVMEVGPGDALGRFVGFNPAKLAAEGKVVHESAKRSEMTRMREKKFIALYIEAEEIKDEADRMAASKAIAADMAEWNKNNPDYQVDPSVKKINAEIRRRSEDREQRTIKRAPKGTREALRRDFEEAR